MNYLLLLLFSRDPRAVVLSRHNFDSSAQSLYANGDLIKEAMLFCHNLANDIVRRRQLETKYPGSFMEVIYDRFVEDPLRYTEDIYKFINVTLTNSVRKWIAKKSNGSQNSTVIANKWKYELPYIKIKHISETCQNVFELLDYNWNL